ncbi:MAG: phosphotransferase [Pseudomonadota bacterium]
MWFGKARSDLDRLADLHWQSVKDQAGLPQKGWTHARLARRDDPHNSSLTQRVSHPTAGEFAYKFQLRPESQEGFEAHFQRQQVAYDSFPHSDALGMPRPVFVDAVRRVSLVDYVDGVPVSEVMKRGTTPDAQLALLTQCGAWLDAFHRCQHETRRFRPAHTLRYYEKLKQKIETREVSVAARGLFLRGIDTLAATAPNYEGKNTVAAIQHGDFHLRNLIWSAGRIVGIDVSKAQIAPVGYDVAKILLDFTSVCREGVALPSDHIIHPDTLAAFFKGYRLVGADDPSFNFLLYARILATLRTVPGAQRDRTHAKTRTLQRLRPIAEKAFHSPNPEPVRHPGKTIVFLLTQSSLERARRGEHVFAEAVQAAVQPLGHRVVHKRNTPQNRTALGADDLTLVHMSDPVGSKGLVFRHAYAGPFWKLEAEAARWTWPIAKADFAPDDIDTDTARAFFDHWRRALVPQQKVTAAPEPFIYVPLQGKLLQRRGFQRASPVDMIQMTLKHSDLPIKATLHPSEAYSDAERRALDDLQRDAPRFRVVELEMHTALATCRYVVTENSSAAFHAILHRRPSILFAQIDFHHICTAFHPRSPSQAFDEVLRPDRPYDRYLYWYWALHAINLDLASAGGALRARMADLGWPIDPARC